jgi:hypothetical protein
VDQGYLLLVFGGSCHFFAVWIMRLQSHQTLPKLSGVFFDNNLPGLFALFKPMARR